MLLRSTAVFCLMLSLFLATLGQAAETSNPTPSIPEIPASTLIYVSDYFSFVGADGQGRVAFALDNNRGRDGEAHQAEHLVVLHDEKKGWIETQGNGSYSNSKKELTPIPDSPFFQFEGTPATGLTVASAKNNLTLKINPIPQRTHRSHEGSVVWMGSTSAVLTWQGRTIPGRVIYEYLVMPDFNRLTRTYWWMWKEFQGLYLSADKTNDIYLHSQLSERIMPLIGKLSGFAAFNEDTDQLNNLQVEVLEREFTLGFYRWPRAWRITWNGNKGPASMTLTLSGLKKIGNWVIGGFSMGILKGELSYDDHTWPIYGLAELIL